jgi:hypothetical protein
MTCRAIHSLCQTRSAREAVSSFGPMPTSMLARVAASAAACAPGARDTLSGALAVSAQLPPNVAASLVEHARRAFTEGMHVAALIGAVIAGAGKDRASRRTRPGTAPRPGGRQKCAMRAA